LSVPYAAVAATPQHMAVSLWLTVGPPKDSGGSASVSQTQA